MQIGDLVCHKNKPLFGLGIILGFDRDFDPLIRFQLDARGTANDDDDTFFYYDDIEVLNERRE